MWIGVSSSSGPNCGANLFSYAIFAPIIASGFIPTRILFPIVFCPFLLFASSSCHLVHVRLPHIAIDFSHFVHRFRHVSNQLISFVHGICPSIADIVPSGIHIATPSPPSSSPKLLADKSKLVRASSGVSNISQTWLRSFSSQWAKDSSSLGRPANPRIGEGRGDVNIWMKNWG